MCYSFCLILSLQVGTTILSAVIFTLGSLALTQNVFSFREDPHIGWPVPLVLMGFFVLLMTIAGVLMLMSAYYESRPQCFAALVFLVLTTIYWIVLSGLSFTNSPTLIRHVCMIDRCAVSFWLIDLNYRGNWRVVGTWGGETLNVTRKSRKRKNRYRRREINNTLIGNGYGNGIGRDERKYSPTNTGIYKENVKPGDKNGAVKPEEGVGEKSKLTENKRKRSLVNNGPIHGGGANIEKAQITYNNDLSGPLNWAMSDIKKYYSLESTETYNNNIRKQMYDGDDYFSNTDLGTLYDETVKQLENNENETNSDEYSGYGEYEEEIIEEEKLSVDGEPKYEVGPTLIGAIAIFAINLMFLLFTTITVWSYSDELKYDQEYDE